MLAADMFMLTEKPSTFVTTDLLAKPVDVGMSTLMVKLSTFVVKPE